MKFVILRNLLNFIHEWLWFSCSQEFSIISQMSKEKKQFLEFLRPLANSWFRRSHVHCHQSRPLMTLFDFVPLANNSSIKFLSNLNRRNKINCVCQLRSFTEQDSHGNRSVGCLNDYQLRGAHVKNSRSIEIILSRKFYGRLLAPREVN